MDHLTKKMNHKGLHSIGQFLEQPMLCSSPICWERPIPCISSNSSSYSCLIPSLKSFQLNWKRVSLAARGLELNLSFRLFFSLVIALYFFVSEVGLCSMLSLQRKKKSFFCARLTVEVTLRWDGLQNHVFSAPRSSSAAAHGWWKWNAYCKCTLKERNEPSFRLIYDGFRNISPPDLQYYYSLLSTHCGRTYN